MAEYIAKSDVNKTIETAIKAFSHPYKQPPYHLPEYANNEFQKEREFWNSWAVRILKRVQYDVSRLPTVDVRPESHGYWIPIFCCEGDKRREMAKDYECSKCGRIVSDVTYSHELDYEFCPYCSAKMDGKDDKK